MNYLADTVTLVRHLRGGRKVGRQVKEILQEADQGRYTIAISGVTLMEILYLSERRRIRKTRVRFSGLCMGSAGIDPRAEQRAGERA